MRVGDTLLSEKKDIARHVVSHFTNFINSISVFQDDDLVEEVVPNLVSTDINVILTPIPFIEEIHHTVSPPIKIVPLGLMALDHPFP